ncbi:transposase InsO family protein [Bradyrhizobium sp. USDA 3397]
MPIEPSCQRAPGGTRRRRSRFGAPSIRLLRVRRAQGRKVWRQLKRRDLPYCAFHSLAINAGHGFARNIRGKPVKTSSDKAAACQQDYVNRQFQSSRPWHSDFTYLATWTGSVYVAFVIGAYAQSIVGLAGLAHDKRRLRARCAGLEQALRRPVRRGGLCSIATGAARTSRSHTPSAAEVGAELSIGSVGDPMTTLSPEPSTAFTRPR